jgi:glycosyltransferase involved in cell wall biosynthesis
MRIGLLSGAYPPAVDGIGDYTHLLASELARQHEVVVFTGRQDAYANGEDFPVVGAFDPAKPASILNLPAAIAAGPALDRLVVQYNPFSFGPRGFNPWLPLTLSHLRKRLRLSIMFHETYVPCEELAQFGMRLWQIPQFYFLSRMADPAYSSCSRWLPVIHRATGREPIPLPVGSNVARSGLSRDEARKRLGIAGDARVLGVFGSAHPSRLLAWICDAANRIAARSPGTVLVYIGADGKALRPGLGPEVRFLDRGLLPSDAVGDSLMAADCLLAPFVDGLSTRRGSVVAAFQHGLPVISTSSAWTDALLVGQEERLIFLSPVEEGADAFASLAFQKSERVTLPDPRQSELINFFDEHFGWPSIARRLVSG